MKALVVDDSRTIRIMLKKFLQAQGFDTLFEAGHGREALDRLKESGPVDLVLVDWNMPVMDGLEFVSSFRKEMGCPTTRVMMVTTESEAGQIGRAMDAGANEYIKKPFTPEVLREKLTSMGFETRDA